MRILGLDPGSLTGVALLNEHTPEKVTTWRPFPDLPCTDANVFTQFRDQLITTIGRYSPDAVAYEEVAAHKGTRAAHIYGGLRAMILVVCQEKGVECLPCPVGTVKKHATGKGNVGKDAMLLAAERKWPRRATNNDEADALWIADYAAKELGGSEVKP